MSITPAQCRAARALLGISQEDLAELSQVSLKILAGFEKEKGGLFHEEMVSIQSALENSGGKFTLYGGVRPKQYESDGIKESRVDAFLTYLDKNLKDIIRNSSLLAHMSMNFIMYMVIGDSYFMNYFILRNVMFWGSVAIIAKLFFQRSVFFFYIFIIIAVLFNPFLIIHLSRAVWWYIDFGCLILIFSSLISEFMNPGL